MDSPILNLTEGQPGWDWEFLPKTNYSRATKRSCSLDGPRRYKTATKKPLSSLPPVGQPIRRTPDGLPDGIEPKPRPWHKQLPSIQHDGPRRTP
jgi:hypothetical protein